MGLPQSEYSYVELVLERFWWKQHLGDGSGQLVKFALSDYLRRRVSPEQGIEASVKCTWSPSLELLGVSVAAAGPSIIDAGSFSYLYSPSLALV